MKIESNIYTRDIIQSPSQTPKQSADERSNKDLTTRFPHDDISSSHNHETDSEPFKGNKHSINSIVDRKQTSDLASVLNPEEERMLQNLFPDVGTNWGHDAYKTADYFSMDVARGNKLDLIS